MSEKKLYTIRDGSFSLGINTDGTLEHRYGIELMGIPCGSFAPATRTFEIIAEDCDLPAENYGMSKHHRNNTIIRATDTGELVFIQRRFLVETKGPKSPVEESTQPLKNFTKEEAL